MRTSSVVTAVVFALLSFAGIAFSQEDGGGGEYNSEYVNSLKGSDGLIQLTDKNFDKVVGGPRDYTVAVFLTASQPQYGCQFCRMVGPSIEKIAYSWNQDHPQGDGLFFAVADIQNTQMSFRKLQLTHAPNLWIYGPSEKPVPVNSGYEPYQFTQTEDQVGPLLSHFSRVHHFNITIHEPFPWDRLAMSVGTFIMLATIVKLAYKTIWRILQKKQIWSAITLVAILMFTGGHMFNMIRKTPYVVGDGKGNAVYFVGGHGNQIAVETQIIALVYAVLAFSTISLVMKVPKIKNPASQSLAALALCALIFVTFSFLMAKFHVKNNSYPFKLMDIF